MTSRECRIWAMARIDRALLAFFGVLVAHEVAYLSSSLAGYDNSIAHGHLQTAWLLGSVGLLAVLGRSLVTSLRRRNHVPDNPVLLAATIGGGYFALEFLERLADGLNPSTLFTEPVFWLGMAVAPLVALLLAFSLRTFATLTSQLLHRLNDGDEPRPAVCSLAATSTHFTCTDSLLSVVSRRGPPFDLNFR